VAAGALAGVFYQRGLLGSEALQFVAEQGHSLGNPTTIFVEPGDEETKIGGPVAEIGRLEIDNTNRERGGTPEWQIRTCKK